MDVLALSSTQQFPFCHISCLRFGKGRRVLGRNVLELFLIIRTEMFNQLCYEADSVEKSPNQKPCDGNLNEASLRIKVAEVNWHTTNVFLDNIGTTNVMNVNHWLFPSYFCPIPTYYYLI